MTRERGEGRKRKDWTVFRFQMDRGKRIVTRQLHREITTIYAMEFSNKTNKNQYRRDPNKSGGGTRSFSITPYSLYGSSNLLSCYGRLHLGWIQLAPPWRFLNFHLEHPQIFKIEEKNGFNFLRVQRVILQNLRVF